RQVGVGDASCRFRKALTKVLVLANLTADEQAVTDLERPITEWPTLNAIVDRLMNNYARFLDIQVDGESIDFLLWNGVDVPTTYASPAIEPDSEHLWIAMLILEGVASDIPTANWDGLVERAVDELTLGQPA